MSWVLIGTVSMKQYVKVPKTHVKSDLTHFYLYGYT